jgi:hypothetical protein
VMEEAESMKQIRKKEKDSRVYGLSLESCDWFVGSSLDSVSLTSVFPFLYFCFLEWEMKEIRETQQDRQVNQVNLHWEVVFAVTSVNTIDGKPFTLTSQVPDPLLWLSSLIFTSILHAPVINTDQSYVFSEDKENIRADENKNIKGMTHRHLEQVQQKEQ